MRECGAQVVVIGRDPVEPGSVAAPSPVDVVSLGSVRDPAEMPIADSPLRAGRGELRGGVLAHGLEHRHARRAVRPVDASDERGVEQVVDSGRDVAPGLGDRLDGVDRGAAAERTQDAEHRPCRLVEQPDAPVDRGPEGPLALGAVPGTAGEQGEHVVEAGSHPLGPQRSDACGSQLEGERDPVDRYRCGRPPWRSRRSARRRDRRRTPARRRAAWPQRARSSRRPSRRGMEAGAVAPRTSARGRSVAERDW